jgi:hypothetical protein
MATTSYGRSTGVRSGAGARGRAPGLASLRAHFQSAWLDRELASGVEPWRTPVHSARSLQITSPRGRRTLADALDKLLRRAEQAGANTTISCVVPVDRPAVLGAATPLADIAARLRDGAPVSTAGVAALRDLLSDGSGPVYSPLSGEALGHVLGSIRDALDVVD